MRTLLACAFVSLLPSAIAHASASSDDNTGRWSDTYVDDNDVLEMTHVKLDGVGKRIVLDGTGDGSFLTSEINPASLSQWGGLYVDQTVASDASIKYWIKSGDTYYGANGQTGTLAALPPALTFGASDRAGYSARAALGAIPATVKPLNIYVRLHGVTIAPSVNALELSWTPRPVITERLEAPASVRSGETIGVKVNVAVSFVDAKDLVVTATLPTVRNNLAAGLQDQHVGFVSATSGGTLAPDGQHVVWNLGTKKAGETFTLVFTTRTNNGLLNGIVYDVSAQAVPAPPASGPVDPPVTAQASVAIVSAPGPTIDRNPGAGVYRIENVNYAFADSDIEMSVLGWNFRSYPGSGGETYFDGYVWDDVSNLVDGRVVNGVSVAPTGTPFAISDGGIYTDHAVQLAVTGAGGGTVTIPAKSVYWRTGHLSVGQAFAYRYKVHTSNAAATVGMTVNACAKLESQWSTQLAAKAGPACSGFKIGVPFTPSGIFAKGEEIRGIKQVSAGEDLVWPVQTKAAFGETMSYHLMTYNTGVSRLDDVVMIDKVPAEMVFEGAFLPPEAAGTVWYYAEADGPGAPVATPPSWDRATGTFGAGWSQQLPADRTTVSWVAFRVPELASSYFPDPNGVVPVSADGEITVTVRPPVGACPATDTTVTDRGLFHVYRYTPPAAPGQPLGPSQAVDGGLLYTENEEHTLVVPSLPFLNASSLTDSPATAVVGQPLVYTLNIVNQSPPSTSVPLDAALDVKVKLDVPVLPVNGVQTPLLVDAVSAPGATITYNLPSSVTLTYAAAIAPLATRTVTLTTRVPSGVIDGTTWSLNATLDWRDDICGANQARLSEPTTFFGLPALAVVKASNFGYGQTGTQLEYALTYVNSGDSPSTKSWMVDRVPPGLSLDSVEVPAHGEVWFSQALPAAVPGSLTPSDPFTDQRVRANFTRAIDADQDGWVTSPYGTATTYVAFNLDDQTLAPPQLVTSARHSVRVRGTVTEARTGTVVANQAAILSKELLQAISNKANFTITTRPGLKLAKTCPEVVATGDGFSYSIDFVNDSSNPDTGLTLVETLPDGVAMTGVHYSWNAAYLASHPSPSNPTLGTQGNVLTFGIGALAPLEGGRVTIDAVVAQGVVSGTFEVPETHGTAVGAGDSREGFATCTVLVENPDLYVRKLVDNPAPRAGETFNYTIVVSNEGAHEAADVVVQDQLPANLEVVPGTAVATPSPWKLAPQKDPVRIGNQLIWSAATGNALTHGADTAGLVPGHSGNVSVIFSARVKAGVLPGTTITNCASASSATGEDAKYANSACVPVTTPLPDPWVSESGPTIKKPGEKVTWTLSYGNGANEEAAGVVVIDTLPDGPVPGPDGVVDVTYVGATVANGEQIWLHTQALGATAGAGGVPAFNPADPAAGGWKKTAAAGEVVTHVAFYAGTLAPLARTRTIQVSALLTRPGGALALPGSTFDNMATIAMTDTRYHDQNPNNNVAHWPTSVPGIDIAVDKTCDPSGSYPGILPGAALTFHLKFENSGTTLAHGLRLMDALPSGVELTAAPAPEVALFDASGQPTTPVDERGVAITAPVRWTRVDDTWYLGAIDTQSPTWYRKVGLRPGDHGELVLTTRVKDTVGNKETIRNRVDFATDYGSTSVEGAAKEEILDNNWADCSVVVYRPDPFVIKTIKAHDGPFDGAAEIGDRIEYQLTYGNSGNTLAKDVVMEDAIPDGLVFVTGSLRGVDPDRMDVT